ncbi:unnamed protein product [Larinioides sclopetarius]|uniref:Uncharacterized protein n=1 Tax=Larinioides sclopetarius TaxID=280406 RepID=A0AAV1YRY4_9ARAC
MKQQVSLFYDPISGLDGRDSFKLLTYQRHLYLQPTADVIFLQVRLSFISVLV